MSTRGKPAANPELDRRAGFRTSRWLAAGIGVLAVMAISGAWISGNDSKTRVLATLASNARLPVTNAAGVPKVDTVNPAPAATIRDEAAPGSAAASAAATALAVPENKQTLKEMLNAKPSPAAPKGGHDILSKALERPSEPATPAKPKAVSTKLALQVARPVPKDKSPAKPSKPKFKAEPDNDVDLLAALMTRAQAKPAASKAGVSTQEQLKQCKRLPLSDAEQCRTRVCAGRGKNDSECRAPA